MSPLTEVSYCALKCLEQFWFRLYNFLCLCIFFFLECTLHLLSSIIYRLPRQPANLLFFVFSHWARDRGLVAIYSSSHCWWHCLQACTLHRGEEKISCHEHGVVSVLTASFRNAHRFWMTSCNNVSTPSKSHREKSKFQRIKLKRCDNIWHYITSLLLVTFERHIERSSALDSHPKMFGMLVKYFAAIPRYRRGMLKSTLTPFSHFLEND